MSCDKERQPVAEFMRESIVFCSTCMYDVVVEKVHVRYLI